MKKNLLVFAAIAISAITMVSCKKNSDDTPSLTGNWTANTLIDWETNHTSGTLTKDTTNFQSGSYLNFAGDGKLYSKLIESGIAQFDTSFYTINGSNVYTQAYAGGPNTDTAQILTISANNTVLHSVSNGSMFSDETWVYLSR